MVKELLRRIVRMDQLATEKCALDETADFDNVILPTWYQA